MTVFSVVTGILGTLGAAVTSLFLMYPLLAVSLLFAIHGFYGTVFYYVGYLNAASCERAFAAIADGTTDYNSLSPIMNRRLPAIQALLGKCIKRGYLVGYTLGTDSLVPVESATNENTTPTEEN